MNCLTLYEDMRLLKPRFESRKEGAPCKESVSACLNVSFLDFECFCALAFIPVKHTVTTSPDTLSNNKGPAPEKQAH
ncbi:hypothetical protein M514_04056 [Trichuris suis]|uniref:Uncharacterized protein n=1 Tax=Trichuris suis TaxID=68888 RepID=A0A085NSR0_9BILA|nr:hypothetical protein M513_04056 [Trichuris suis]KFD72506.1 hypothetical protein M514_04056 [Trichuris suis]